MEQLDLLAPTAGEEAELSAESRSAKRCSLALRLSVHAVRSAPNDFTRSFIVVPRVDNFSSNFCSFVGEPA